MRCRAANTGYMASAPPPQPLEHFFDLTRRTGGLSGGLSGKLARRMLLIDHTSREFALIYKEGETKAYKFESLHAVEAVEGGVRLSFGAKGGEAIVLTTHSAAELAGLLEKLRAVLAAHGSGGAGGSGGADADDGAPSGRVENWLMSGTVEKEGKMRWAARWLVLTYTRLYVLRDVASLCPLNVIPLDSDVRVVPGARVFSLVTKSRSFNFKTSDEKLTDAWVAALTEHTAAAAAGGQRWRPLSPAMRRADAEEIRASSAP